ncbi:hypothetical protein [Actinoallomurus iriomotensis]|uniref:Fibronectin type-III domain-containing protein n=1 Tax=Actinoallomurus iriomotensis TaxID=478107 RepID=A0A9W6RRE9_9ACTN|nr:hypothetical protein [Actinoallomurus iriomotensis]GLY80175.1 hypothetical protein Airi01_084420 [Actinoallomurus iriomotensis]
MVFDEQRYVREVLEPARAAGNQPPDDLRVRYALVEPLNCREVAESVKRVRMCWRKSRGQLRFRRLIDRLEGDHLKLAPLFERAALGDLAPLRAELTTTADRAGRRRAELRTRLLDAAGEMRTLAPGDLREIGGEAAELAREAGIEIREPDVLPAAPPYAGYPRARDALDALGARHLREFVTGEPRAGRVLGSVPDLRPAIRRVAEQWSRRPHDGNRTNADTVLVALKRAGAASRRASGVGGEERAARGASEEASATTEHAASRRASGVGGEERAARGASEEASATTEHAASAAVDYDDVAELVLYDVVARLRERHQQRASEGALLRFAIDDLGVDEDDARRLVFSVIRESGVAGGLAARLRDLIDAGEIHAAAELASVAGPAELTGDAELLAAEARRRISSATALRQEAAALVLTDPDEAWLRLADALRLVGDLPGAADLQAGLPPRAPGRMEAVVEGDEVALSWAPTPSRVGEIGYVVARCLGRVPRHPGDGETLPSGGGFARDPAPPLNAPLFYAVFAVRGTAASAPAVAGPLHVRPEPADVFVRAADGVVAGRFTAPPEAVRVLVTRDGTPVPTERGGFRDETVTNGTTYHYRVAAAYLSADGHETITSGVHVAATPAARPDPVRDLSVEQDPAGHLVVTYDEPPHGQVEMVAMPGPPPWPAGTTLAVEEVHRAGRVLRTAPVPGGVALHAGPGVLLAVSVSGDVATIGAHREHVNLTPPRELIAERRGEMITLGFDWPTDVTEAEVRWRCGDGEESRLPIGRAGYDAHGGVRLPSPGGEAVTIEVAAAATAYGRRVTGMPVRTVVPGRTIVGYELRRSHLRGPLVVTLTGAAPTRVRRLVLVARSGPMPQRPADGETVMSWDDVEIPTRLAAGLPRLRRPYWLRCFAEDPAVELRDPPVRDLKVR